MGKIDHGTGATKSASEGAGDRDVERADPVTPMEHAEIEEPSAGEETDGPEKPKRGRKPGGGRKPGAAKKLTKLDLKVLGEKVAACHKVVGMVTGLGALAEITDAQGTELADAVIEVCQHYDLKPDPKTLAWVQLTMVLSAVYAPKAYTIVTVKKEMKRQAYEKRRAAQTQAATRAPADESPRANPNQENIYNLAGAASMPIME